jgi:hypothetical protein
MRKGIFIVGIVVILVGVGILTLGLATLSQTSSIPPPAITSQSGQVLAISPPFVGSGTVNLAWSGANQSFRFEVFQCSDSSCSSPASTTPLATGGGPSGTASFTGSGGTSYAVLTTSQVTTNSVPVTISLSGLTLLELIGIIVAAVGGAVAALGFLLKAKPKRVVRAAPAAEEEKFVTKPFQQTEDAAAASYVAPPVRVEPQYEGSEKPVYFQPSEEDAAAAESAGAASTPTGGGRPPIKCTHCGTLNEAWVTNCRKCTRPLSHTG